jgi:hypothetical protein
LKSRVTLCSLHILNRSIAAYCRMCVYPLKVRTHHRTKRTKPQEPDWLKEASLLESTADITGDLSGLGVGCEPGGDNDDVPDWLKD